MYIHLLTFYFLSYFHHFKFENSLKLFYFWKLRKRDGARLSKKSVDFYACSKNETTRKNSQISHSFPLASYYIPLHPTSKHHHPLYLWIREHLCIRYSLDKEKNIQKTQCFPVFYPKYKYLNIDLTNQNLKEINLTKNTINYYSMLYYKNLFANLF